MRIWTRIRFGWRSPCQRILSSLNTARLSTIWTIVRTNTSKFRWKYKRGVVSSHISFRRKIWQFWCQSCMFRSLKWNWWSGDFADRLRLIIRSSRCRGFRRRMNLRGIPASPAWTSKLSSKFIKQPKWSNKSEKPKQSKLPTRSNNHSKHHSCPP